MELLSSELRLSQLHLGHNSDSELRPSLGYALGVTTLSELYSLSNTPLWVTPFSIAVKAYPEISKIEKGRGEIRTRPFITKN